MEVKLSTTTPLAIGAVIGGLAGKALFEFIRSASGNESLLGGVQAICLAIITAAVLLYIRKKDGLRAFHIESKAVCILIGSLLGIISSFLGIGGGTSNVAVLFLFFSMDAKTAAKNSLYIIVFSQLAGILKTVAAGTVPAFAWPVLFCMAFGGVCGALQGSGISAHISNHGVEKALQALLIVIVCINIRNAMGFLTM